MLHNLIYMKITVDRGLAPSRPSNFKVSRSARKRQGNGHLAGNISSAASWLGL